MQQRDTWKMLVHLCAFRRFSSACKALTNSLAGIIFAIILEWTSELEKWK